MVVFQDIITSDVLLNDSFNIKEVDGVVYEVDCSLIAADNRRDVGVDEEEDGDEEDRQVIDLVKSFSLCPTAFDKRSYIPHIKDYLHRVETSLKGQGTSAEEIEEIRHKTEPFLKNILSHMSNWEFYTGESQNLDGMVVLIGYRDDGVTPYALLWKHGLVELEA